MTGGLGVANLPPAGRAALRAGVVGNWVDNIHVFLPLIALGPAMGALAGPGAGAAAGPLVVVAMLLGRPVGGTVFGQVSDRLGRTRTTRVAIAGTALCALGIAVMPTHVALGAATLWLVLVLRFLGGVFVAGEYSAAIPLAMEWSAPRRRGLMSGLILSMAPLAQGSIAFATAAMLGWLGQDEYALWGWRALFVVGALCSGAMLVFYSLQVADAPAFHRHAGLARARRERGQAVLVGRHSRTFWQVFALMSGLWLMTAVTVLILPGRLVEDARLAPDDAAIAMGVASLAQAAAMVLAGHLSTVVGRRALFVGWGLVALLTSPFVWRAVVVADDLPRAALWAALLQVVTVSMYGPVAAYLSERFPTGVRSTGYGMGYSLSLVLPALYPLYLPALEGLLGRQGAPTAMLLLGGALVVGAAFVGPRLAPRDFDAEIDEVAREAEEVSA